MGRNISVTFGGDTGAVQDARVNLTVATRAFGSLRLECEKEPPQPDEAMSQVASNLVMTTLKDELLPRAASDLRMLIGDTDALRQALEARLNQAAAGQGIKIVVVDLEVTMTEADRQQIAQKYAGMPPLTAPPPAPTAPPLAPSMAPLPPPSSIPPGSSTTPLPPISIPPPVTPPRSRTSPGGWSTDITQGIEEPPPGFQPLNIWSGSGFHKPPAPAPFTAPSLPPAATAASGPEKTCAQCGAKLGGAVNFCTGCGAKL